MAENFSEPLLFYSMRESAMAESQKAHVLVPVLLELAV